MKDSVKYMEKLGEEMTPDALDVYIDETSFADSLLLKENTWNRTLSTKENTVNFTIASGMQSNSKMHYSPEPSPTGQKAFKSLFSSHKV